MKATNVILFLISSVILMGCNLFKDVDKSELPSKPGDIIILHEKKQGMIGGYESIYITNDSCAYEVTKNGNKQIVNFNLTPDQITEIYSAFVVNKFSEIESEKREIYDRGGTKITLTVKNTKYIADNSGMQFVKADYFKYYESVEGVITKTAFKEINKQKIDLKIELSEALKNSPYYLFLSVNGNQVFNELVSNHHDGQIMTTVLPKYNTFEITLMEKGSTSNTIKGKYSLTIEDLKGATTIKLSLKDDHLIYE